MNDPLLEDIACNFCGSRRSRLLYNRPYAIHVPLNLASFVATTDEYDGYGSIVRCVDCGLTYTNPRPKREELARGYREYVDEQYLSESSSRSINAHLSLNVIKRFISSGKLLEVGASSGYFLNAARVDFDVAGLEPSEWACAIARERYKIDVYAESLEETRRFNPESFDVVALIDVIEHVCDPQSALIRAAELLKRGGVLYLVTPDISRLSARILRGYWWGLRPAHVYYFNRKTIQLMLQEAGLEPVLSQSFGRIFTYAYWASRLRHYPSFIYETLLWGIRRLGIEDKFFYLNTRDSMEICARKP